MVILTPLTYAQPRLILWYSMLYSLKQNALVLTCDKLLHKAIVLSYTFESGNFFFPRLSVFCLFVGVFFLSFHFIFLWQEAAHAIIVIPEPT